RKTSAMSWRRAMAEAMLRGPILRLMKHLVKFFYDLASFHSHGAVLCFVVKVLLKRREELSLTVREHLSNRLDDCARGVLSLCSELHLSPNHVDDRREVIAYPSPGFVEVDPFVERILFISHRSPSVSSEADR